MPLINKWHLLGADCASMAVAVAMAAMALASSQCLRRLHCRTQTYRRTAGLTNADHMAQRLYSRVSKPSNCREHSTVCSADRQLRDQVDDYSPSMGTTMHRSLPRKRSLLSRRYTAAAVVLFPLPGAPAIPIRMRAPLAACRAAALAAR